MKKISKKTWIIVGAVVAVLAISGAQDDENKALSSDTSNQTKAESIDSSVAEKLVKIKAETEAETKSVENNVTVIEEASISKDTTVQKTTAEPLPTYHKEGVYKIGKDLPAGEYLLIAYEDQYVGGYMCVSSDSNQKNIILNELFQTFHYVTVEDGQYLELSKCGAVSVEEDSLYFKAYKDLGPGMYKIGTDIPAGEYRLTADKDAIAAYSCIYNNSTAHRKIISNDIINNNSYVTVTDGQYLLLSSCTAALEE